MGEPNGVAVDIVVLVNVGLTEDQLERVKALLRQAVEDHPILNKPAIFDALNAMNEVGEDEWGFALGSGFEVVSCYPHVILRFSRNGQLQQHCCLVGIYCKTDM